MSTKASLTDQQVTINRFAFLLLKHFSKSKIKVQDFCIKIPVDQLCTQDIKFLNLLEFYTGTGTPTISLNVSRSGKGLVVLIGVAQLRVIPDFLVEYKRSEK